MASSKERWEKLDSKRDTVLRRARDAADLTIPAMMPRDGHNENTNLPQPYQSLGARGLNNLASKLALALLPAGNPFFRLNVGEDVAQEVEGLTEIQEQLRKIENRAMKRVENSNLRISLHGALKQLACCGNALLHMPDEGGARTFRMNQYVVVRDAMGNWRELLIHETVHPSTLDEDVVAEVGLVVDVMDEEEVDVYTHVTRVGNKVEWSQEINEVSIEGSKGRTKYTDSPYIPLRWSAIEGEDYGRGHVEEYMGDLRSLEGLSKSVVQFSAAAAKVIFLERPNSSTDVEALVNAESGEFVEGNPEDISTLQVQKYPDFQVAKATIDDLSLRLSHAFLLTTGTVRNAERVTAEEIRMHAQELENVLGGVYTVLAQELQLPIVRRLMAQMRKAGELPSLPDNALEPVIVTGFDALGRGHELNKYRQYFADGAQLFGPEFMQQFSANKVAEVMALHHNVDITNIQKSEEDLAAEGQNARMDAVLDKAAGPMAGAMGEVAKSQMIEG